MSLPAGPAQPPGIGVPEVLVSDWPDAIRLTIWGTDPPNMITADLSPRSALEVALKLLEAAKKRLACNAGLGPA